MKLAAQFQMRIPKIRIQLIVEITRVWVARPQRDAILCVGRFMETYTEFEAVHVVCHVLNPVCALWSRPQKGAFSCVSRYVETYTEFEAAHIWNGTGWMERVRHYNVTIQVLSYIIMWYIVAYHILCDMLI